MTEDDVRHFDPPPPKTALTLKRSLGETDAPMVMGAG